MIDKEIIKLPKNKTKIICTIGPTSKSTDCLKKMIDEGMNIARLNFSHGTLEEHSKLINNIRKASKIKKINIPILADLPGAKIRIGKLKNEKINLEKGQIINLTTKNILGTNKIIPVNYKKLTKSVKKGDIIFLNDGYIELKVIDRKDEEVKCKVVMGGILYSHKGINIPGKKIYIDPVTKKDLEIVDFALKKDLDIFCVSFVENSDNILKVKNYAEKKGKKIFIVAKIERDEAIENFDELLKVADGIMIARGDLGIQIPIENIPTIQKKLIRRANIAGIPVITATQMLKSMTETNRPTRAEVTDVANAIIDGTDAVMLSEETAVGSYPVETVRMMVKIAQSTEKRRNGAGLPSTLKEYLKKTVTYTKLTKADVISLNAIEAAKILNTRYILSTTSTGSTARRISRFKPDCWIISFSRNKETCDFLSFSYGVFPVNMINKEKSWHNPILKYIKKRKMVKKGDKVILTQRRFEKEKGSTDSLGIITI